MAFHWVNLGNTHKEVKEYSFLWSPQFKVNEDGKKIHKAGWSSVSNVKKGDTIFCYVGGHIIYAAVARTDTYLAPRPENRPFKPWVHDGYKVDIKLFPIENPIKVKEFQHELNLLLDNSLKPKIFDINGEVCQFYLAPIPPSAGSYLLDLTGDISEQIDFDKNDIANLMKGEDIIVLSKAR